MGIRGLAHLLQPYRVAVDFPELGRSFQNDHGDNAGHDQKCLTGSPESHIRHCSPERTEAAVLDGPALAYHAYYVALARRTSARNALEAMPGYGEINQIAVEILDVLEMHGISIAAIYFDGLLPEAKRDVRLDRLNGYLRELESYRTQHSASSTSAILVTTSSNHFSVSPIPVKLKSLPAVPFLVPSVIEALYRSQYRNITSVIPGEADSFCASYAKRHDAMVITSDSDLLVYELACASSVVLWKDIELLIPEGGYQLRIRRYETASIAQRFGLETMQPLAFAINEDPFKTLTVHVNHAKRLQSESNEGFIAFGQRYSTDLCDVQGAEATAVSLILRTLDPRISEWVHEIQKNDRTVQMLRSQSTIVRVLTVHMYLPVLIEDTNRSSAWDIGAETRVLAYSLLHPSTASIFSTKEVMRRGNRITERPFEHLELRNVQKVLEQMGFLFDHFGSFNIQSDLRWPFNAIYLLCQQTIYERRALPTRHVLKRLLLRRRLCNDWDFVYRTAQMQAAAYSFRMLKQCFDVFMALDGKGIAAHTAQKCAGYLQTMPSIATLFDEQMDVDEASVEKTVDMLYEALGIKEDEHQSAQMTSSGKKRKKKRKKVVGKGDNSPRGQLNSPSNMFSLLSACK